MDPSTTFLGVGRRLNLDASRNAASFLGCLTLTSLGNAPPSGSRRLRTTTLEVCGFQSFRPAGGRSEPRRRMPISCDGRRPKGTRSSTRKTPRGSDLPVRVGMAGAAMEHPRGPQQGDRHDDRVNALSVCSQVGQSRELHLPAQTIGYARISTNEQGLAPQRKAPAGLVVPGALVNGDHGVTGRNGNGRG